MSVVVADLRYAFRTLTKSPGFTSVAVLILSLGIGATTAIFSAIEAVLLRPLPYRDPSRLVMLEGSYLQLGMDNIGASPAEFLDEQKQTASFERLAAFRSVDFSVTGESQAERIPGARITADLFPLLGVSAALGRGLLPEDVEKGARVAVLSDALWRRRFGADRAAVGRTIRLYGEAHTIVGIMPPGFEFPHPAYPRAHRADVWAPLVFTPNELLRRATYGIRVIGRLKQGVTYERAAAELTALGQRWQRELPDYRGPHGEDGGWLLTAIPLSREIAGPRVERSLAMLFGAVGLVLLIACANVALLVLTRGVSRRRETAIRLALGAGRGRLVRQLLMESTVLAILAGVAGALLALWLTDLLASWYPAAFPRLNEVRLDGTAFAFTLVLSLVTALVFGLAPSLRASRTDVAGALRSGGGESDGFLGRRPRRLFVAFELALSVVVLAGAGLLLHSFLRLRCVDPGFDPDRVVALDLTLPESRYPTDVSMATFFDRLLPRVSALPGVRSAAAASLLPLEGPGFGGPFSIEGRRFDVSNPSFASLVSVSPGYFRALSIRLLRGRALTDDDVSGQPNVVVVSDTLARRHFAGQDPLGRKIKLGAPGSPRPWLSIVGVAADTPESSLGLPPRPTMYVPLSQSPAASVSIVVRADREPSSLAPAVRRAVFALDPEQPVHNVRALPEVVSNSMETPRLAMRLMAVFAGLAVLLAAVGVYGITSYSVSRRAREMGIRLALGARPEDLVRLTIGEELRTALAGIGAGVVGSLLLTRAIAGLLFGVRPWDAATFGSVPLLLVGVFLLASYLPARRVSRVDPMTALRSE